MQEHRVTTFGETRALPDPFFVLATQNPIELEGTYPLPEAQLDRFMVKVEIVGVDQSVLEEILTTRVHGEAPPLEPVLTWRICKSLHGRGRRASAACGCEFHFAAGGGVASESRGSAGRGAQFRQVRQFAARRDCDWGDCARAGAAAREAECRIRRSPAGGGACAGASHLVLDYAAKLEGWDGRRVIGAMLEAVPEVERGLPQTLEAVKP